MFAAFGFPAIDKAMLYILDMVITIKAVMSDVPVPAHLLCVVTKPLFPGQNEDTGYSNASAVVGIVVDVKVAFFTQSLPVDEKIIDDVMHVIEVVDSIAFDLFVIHDDFNHIVHDPIPAHVLFLLLVSRNGLLVELRYRIPQ